MNDQISFIGSQIIRQNSHNRAGAEIIYAEGGRKKLLVKFTNKMQQSWIGQFERDDRQGISKVFDIRHTSLVLVIAGGRGYLVDIETKDIRRISNGCRGIVSAIKTTFPEYYIAATGESLSLLTGMELSGRFSLSSRQRAFTLMKIQVMSSAVSLNRTSMNINTKYHSS